MGDSRQALTVPRSVDQDKIKVHVELVLAFVVEVSASTEEADLGASSLRHLAVALPFGQASDSFVDPSDRLPAVGLRWPSFAEAVAAVAFGPCTVACS